MKILRKSFAAAAALIAILATVPAKAVTDKDREASYTPSAENLAAREKFQDDKFGIFIHWGLYAMLGDNEWAMNNQNINYIDYQVLAGAFYPSGFNAEEWVKAIKASGAKYITITSRHHEGFSMFDSAYTDYDIVDATPFKRDIIKELSEACRKEGLTLNFYYSHTDWHRLDYPLGRTGRGVGRPTDKQNWESYYTFMNNQLTELLTHYGPIGAIWFDGWWDHQDDATPFDWHLREQYALVHSLQPSCLVINNHHQPPFPGEDAQTFERDLPGENKAGMSGEASIGKLPLETCETMNGNWGYTMKDHAFKSVDEVVRLLVGAAGRGGNLLLNIGPQPDGRFPEGSLRILEGIGKWLSVYGDSIYGTRAGAIEPHTWGATTSKGDTQYVHILKLEDKDLFLPFGDRKIKTVTDFVTGEKIPFSKVSGGIVVNLDSKPEGPDYVLIVK